MKQDPDNMAEHKSSKVLPKHVDVLSAIQGGYRVTWRPSTRSTCALLYMYCLCYNVSGGLGDGNIWGFLPGGNKALNLFASKSFMSKDERQFKSA